MCVKGVAFVNIRYTKGVIFLSKIVYKKAAVVTRGRGFRPYKMLLTTPLECVVLTFESVLMKSYGVTIETKSLQQYFNLVLFI